MRGGKTRWRRPGPARSVAMMVETSQMGRQHERLRVVDAGRVARLAASIAELGQRTPVFVTPSDVLVDGYHRLHAAERLSLDVLDAVEVGADGPEALVLAWQMQTGRRRTALEESWLVAELLAEGGMSQSELSLRLRRSRAWVSGRLALVRLLSEAVVLAVRAGTVPPNGATTSLVPMARISSGAVDRLVANLVEPVTVRQVDSLWRGWRSADIEGRLRIEQLPHLFLRATESTAPNGVDDEGRLVDRLHGLARLCGLARKGVESGLFTRVNAEMREAWTEASSAYRSLLLAVSRVGPGEA